VAPAGQDAGLTNLIPGSPRIPVRFLEFAAMQSEQSLNQRCAVCRGRGRRSDGNACRACDGLGKIPGKKVARPESHPWNKRYILQWKRPSGLVY